MSEQDLDEFQCYLEDAKRNQIINPDPHNQDELVRSCLFWVVSLAQKFRRKHPTADLMDCIQHGNMGAMHAATKYDPARGCTFSTYATPWIKVFISRKHRDTNRNIHVSASTQVKWAKLGKSIPRECSINEIPQGATSPYCDLIPDPAPNPEVSTIQKDEIERCMDLINQLPQMEAQVLKGRLIDEARLEDVAAKIQPSAKRHAGHNRVTKERARQIEKNALKKVQLAAGVRGATGIKPRSRVMD